MSRASEEALGNLHAAIAGGLLTRLRSNDATASDYSNAIKFCKDNNITCTPGASSALDALQKELERAGGAELTPEDEADIEAAMDRINNGG